MSRASILWILVLHLTLSSVLAFPEDVEVSSEFRNSYEQADDAINATEKLRDKRALGLILSGLAQVFGYTLSPVQLTLLPNLDPVTSALGGLDQPAAAPVLAFPTSQTPPNAGKPTSSAAPSPAAPALPAITPAPSPTMAAAPRQRETIRFTGVVNFGNGSNVLGHLQQFERIFHGSSTTPAPATMATQAPATPVTSSSASMTSFDARTPINGKTPVLTPFLVKIPLPISNTDLSTYRKTADVLNLSVENKEIFDGKDVMKPPSLPRIINPHLRISEPPWKKHHEQRIAQLERTQEEHAEKLKDREYEKSQERNVNDSGERSGETYSNHKIEAINDDQNDDCNCKETNSETYRSNPSNQDEDSREKYHSSDKTIDYPATHNSEDSSESGNHRGSQQLQDHNAIGIHKPFKFGEPHPSQITLTNYTGIQPNHQLPIGDYYDKNQPEQIRNSYGEVLEDDYLEKLQNPQGNNYKSENSDKDNYASKEQGERGSSAKQSEEDDAVARLREEYGLPAPESKYEEYNLNENYNTDRNDRKIARAPTARFTGRRHYNNIPTRVLKTPNNFQNSNDADSSEEAEKLNQNMEFLKYSAHKAPVQFLYQPDELDNTHRKQPVLASANILNHEFNKISPSQDTGVVRMKLDDLMPKFGLSQPALPRKLHEGEEKKLQLWPAPFDIAFDSTEVKTLSADPRFALNHLLPSSYEEHGTSRKPYGALVGPTRGFHQKQQTDPRSGYNYLGEKLPPPESSLQLPLGQNSYAGDRVILRFGQPANKDASVDSTTEEIQGILRRYRHEATEKRTGKINLMVNPSSPKEVRSESTLSQSASTSNGKKVPRRRRIRPSNKQSDWNISRNKRNVETDSTSKKRENDQNSNAPAKTSTSKKSFYDPKSAHDFFGFSKNDYSFDDEEKTADSSNPSSKKISEEEEEILGFIIPEPSPYKYDESISKFTDESETKPLNVKVKEYSNKLATLKVHQQKQDSPNGPVRYIDFVRNL